MRVQVVLMATLLAAIGGCAARAATPVVSPSSVSNIPSVGNVSPGSTEVTVPWELVSSDRNSASVVVRYQIGGCYRTPKIWTTESAMEVTIGVKLLSDAKSDDVCPADAWNRTSTVKLSRPLGDRTLHHAT